MRRSVRTFLALLAGAGAIFSVATGLQFRRDMERAEAALAGKSASVATRFGKVEYAVAGEGPAVLMLHGTGGGFDQGLLFAEALAARGHVIVAPSRFGYLGSSLPPDPTPQRQAQALAELLDRLGIARVVVVGGSAGAVPAAAFALLFPEQTRGLVLIVPATNVSGRDPVTMSAAQKTLLEGVASSDFLYWAALQAMPARLTETLLATDPGLVSAAAPAEQARVRRILQGMLPISRRTRGLLLDGQLAGAPAPFDYAGIGVPTLLISAEDDRFNTAATARRLAQMIPEARLVVYPTGGHVWVGRDAEVAAEMARFIAALPGG